ncbi:MAG TPA: hypothetical protein VFX15_00150 [Actinomycetes bacterium]|nr:hypothetical protein [Actinomycetes bacterium]
MHRFLIAGLILVGCSTENKPTDDLSDDLGTYDETGWTIVMNFDEFPNVGYRCIGGDKVYTTTRQSDGLVVVPNSPDCRDGGS